MVKGYMVAIGALLLVAAPLRAEDHPGMAEARNHLGAARDALKDAGQDYGGHRAKALQHVNEALQEIQEGLATAGKKENQLEHKANKLEHKGDKADTQAEKLRNRVDKMQAQ